MKKLVSFTVLLSISLILLSWGSLGHRTIGLIAQNHLTPKAQTAIHDLLGTSSLEDVSTWADEVRSNPEYRNTSPWHYINLPLGLNRLDFEKQVRDMSQPNVYSALVQNEQQLLNPNTSRDQKIISLKLIVHFIGDLHQPMHVSRAEDQGGNKIQVNYDGKGTNLHALWDSRLLDHLGLGEDELAKQCDNVTPQQIRQWQNQPLMDWVWESYQTSSQLYSEIEQMNKKVITEDYYQKHLPIIEDRIEKAGIRLAGVLNEIFKGGAVNGTIIPPPDEAPGNNAQSSQEVIKFTEIELKDVGNYIGKDVKVCGKIYGIKEFSSMTLINLGAAYPNQLLTLVMKEDAKGTLNGKDGQNVCAFGRVELYKGKPQIVVAKKNMIK